jgi:hypothetical protein
MGTGTLDFGEGLSLRRRYCVCGVIGLVLLESSVFSLRATLPINSEVFCLVVSGWNTLYCKFIGVRRIPLARLAFAGFYLPTHILGRDKIMGSFHD